MRVTVNLTILFAPWVRLLYTLVATNSDYLYLGYILKTKGETNRIITAVYYIQNKPTLLLITVAMNQPVCVTMIQKRSTSRIGLP